MERISPEPKSQQLSEVIVSDSRKRRTLTSLTPIPSLARPVSPQLSGKALEKTLSKINAKRDTREIKPDFRSISTMKEMVSGRKSKHTDMTGDIPPPSLTPKPLTLHKKKLPGIGAEGPEFSSQIIEGSSGKARLKGALRGIPKRYDTNEESHNKLTGSSSPPAKQWEFKIPKQVSEASKLDTSIPLEGEDESKSLRPPQGPPPMLKFQRHSFSLNAVLPSNSNNKMIPSPVISKKSNKAISRTKASPQPGQCDIVVSGHQRIGNLDDDASAATIHTLAVLEGAVARERRLKEELAQAQKQVVLGFRAVVKSFMAAMNPSPSLAPVAMKLMSTHRSAPGISVPMLKCSVVVHTLVANVQSHVRQLQSRILVELLRKGNDMQTAKRSIDSRAATLAPLDTEILNEAMNVVATTPSLADLASSEALDSQTITQLKQLYFAYYDCESYVLDSNEDHSPTAKRLASAGARGIRNVIEEANVLVEGYDEDEPRALSEHDTGPTHEGEGSMLFDEQREWRQIYSDDEDDFVDDEEDVAHTTEVVIGV